MDIGANIGYYSFLALDHVGATGAIYSFECNPEPLAAFKRSIELHRPHNLFLEQFAIWRDDGQIAFSCERESGHSHIASSVEKGVAVVCRSLDSWVRERNLERIDVIKIDVEGCELQVLEGAQEMLASHHPLIVCELDPSLTRRFGYEPSRLIQMLGGMGYQTETVVGALSPTIVARYGA